ncbi:MAG: class I SAM-dependent methyltransferase [Cyanobacteria bacterium J06650_10]
MVSRKEVVWGYKLLLEREPESEAVITEKMTCRSVRELISILISSEEFQEKARLDTAILSQAYKQEIASIFIGDSDMPSEVEQAKTLESLIRALLSSEAFIGKRHIFDGERAWRFLSSPPLKVDVELSDDKYEQLSALVEKTWQYLGENDAYWSVMSDEQFRGVLTDEVHKRFYDSGKIEAKTLKALIQRHGIQSKDIQTLLEYGCGVGRVSNWLCSEFEYADVIGVDISQAHLEKAKFYIKQVKHLSNFSTHHTNNLSSLKKLPAFDIGYSRIVLQHSPPPIIKRALDALLGALNNGGLLVVQIPVHAEGYTFDAQQYITDQGWCEPGTFELHLLPQEHILHSIEQAGCKLLELFPDQSVGIAHWLSLFFVIKK